MVFRKIQNLYQVRSGNANQPVILSEAKNDMDELLAASI